MEIEIESDKLSLNPKLVCTFIIFFTIGIILTFSFILISEILSAKKGCEEIDGNYKLKSFNHFCNNQSFQKYTDGSWKYEQKPVNVSGFID